MTRTRQPCELSIEPVCYDCGFPVQRPPSWLCDACDDEAPQPERARPHPQPISEGVES